ncbi:hypothetical protein FG386_002393 [Cryptosporidium ryanae]|uniref:uncharacterized protein n=1 Tax=Cryptosporidium ryanae TaxID=515981 RepID=UPI00351A7625|nr:hypothetical protein FG386_002393 [Cryptosporidium ryanae]
MENSRKPVVLEKIHLESRKVFSTNNRRINIEERKNELRPIKETHLKRYSFYDRRNKLFCEIPPHPKKILIPIFENQMIFVSGVILTLLHKDVISNTKKNMIDFIIIRSLFCIFVLLFQLLELYILKRRVRNYSTEMDLTHNGLEKMFNLSTKSKKLLFLWMLISGIITVSQPVTEMLINIKTISSFQLFTPLITVLIFLVLTSKFNKEKKVKILKKNTFNEIFSADKSEIGKLINNEIENHNIITRNITDNYITKRQLLVVFLIFTSLLIANPDKIVVNIYSGNNISFIKIGTLIALILPCLHDIVFHLVCIKITDEFQLNTNDKNYTFKDIERRICNVYIHIFMTLGQIFIVFPICLLIRFLLYRIFDGEINAGKNESLYFVLETILASIFHISNKEALAIIFSAISMIGIYNRYKINNAETYGIVGLVTIQGFQTLLSTSMRHNIPLWIGSNIISLIISVLSIFILKLHEMDIIFKITLLYNRWFVIYKTEPIDSREYVSEEDYKKYYKTNIRIIGGSFDLNSKNNSNLMDNVSENGLETENLLKSKHFDDNTFFSKQLNVEKILTNKNYMNTPVNSAKVLLLQE